MVSKRVLLINVPFYRLLGSRYNANSLGIAYVAAVLNKNGHDAWLYNADYVNERHFINLKQLFSNFDDYKKYFENEDHELWGEVVQNILAALCRSILFITGTMSRSLSIARYAFARVWASTPCDASTTSRTPSHAARLLDTS